MPDCTISCPNWLLNQSVPVAAAHVSLSIRWVIYKVQRGSLISTVDRTLRQCGSSSRHMWHRKAASIQGAAGCALLLPIYHLPLSSFFTSGQCTKPFPGQGFMPYTPYLNEARVHNLATQIAKQQSPAQAQAQSGLSGLPSSKLHLIYP